MNYFRLHLGDMARDTAHLTALEFGIYSLLMQWYYANERPIPDAAAHRYARSGIPETQAVLVEFFKRDGDVWRHKRVDAEIAAYQVKAEFNREVGKRGGRPKKPKGNPEETQPVSEINPSHKPIANIHKEAEEQKLEHAPQAALPTKPKRPDLGHRIPDDWQLTPELEAYCRQKRPDLDPQDQAERFALYWQSKAGKDARKTNWGKTYMNWICNAKSNGGTNGTNRQSPKLSLADQAAQLMLERRQKRAAEAEAAIVGSGPGRTLAHDA